jgi:hypothetical protein
MTTDTNTPSFWVVTQHDWDAPAYDTIVWPSIYRSPEKATAAILAKVKAMLADVAEDDDDLAKGLIPVEAQIETLRASPFSEAHIAVTDIEETFTLTRADLVDD